MARPRNTVRDDHGREVYGLSFTSDKRAHKHRYYMTGRRPIKWLGYDKNEAIRRFLDIKSREVKEKIAVGPAADEYEELHETKRRQVRDDRGFLDAILAAKDQRKYNVSKLSLSPGCVGR